MRSLKRQGGFLVETILAMVVFFGVVTAYFLPMMLEEKRNQEAQEYANHIRFVINQIHHYQHFKVTNERLSPTSYSSWPKDLDHLVNDYPKQYWNECSHDEELLGACVRPDYVPWTNERIKSIVSAPDNQFIMTIPLSKLAHDAKEFKRWGNPLIKIPGAKQQRNDIVITLRSETLALMFEDIVLRNGTATLRDDWDVGGDNKITNASDVTIAGNDSQISVSEWLTQTHVVQAWGTLKKPDCPKGMTPDISLSVSSLDVKYPWALSGSVKPWVTDWATKWTVGLDMTLYNITTGEYRHERNSGNVLAVVQCKK